MQRDVEFLNKCHFGLKLGSDNTFYHGTTKERYEKIRWEGFRVSTGINTPAAFGVGVYLTQSLKDAGVYAGAKSRDDTGFVNHDPESGRRLGGKGSKKCVIEVKLKTDSKVVHVDSTPGYKQRLRMEKDPPDWLVALLKWKREKLNNDEYFEYWKTRYYSGFIDGMDEFHRHEVSDFAKQSGCDLVHFYTTFWGIRKNKRDIWLLLNNSGIETISEKCKIR